MMVDEEGGDVVTEDRGSDGESEGRGGGACQR